MGFKDMKKNASGFEKLNGEGVPLYTDRPKK